MPPEEIADSPLERLRKRLYAPKSVDGLSSRALSQSAPQAPQHWEAPPPPPPELPKKRMPLATMFLLGAAGFFVLAGIATTVVLFLGGRSVSADHLDVHVEGPTTVAGGDAVPLLVTVTNNNPLPIHNATFTVIFPDGTVDADDPSRPLSHYDETIGTLAAGASKRITVRAAYFGGENQRVTIPFTIEYTTENSNATFTKKADYDFVISSSPVSLSVSNLSELSSGQSITVSVRVRSNADAALQNVAVQATYPFGFAASKTEPAPVTGSLFVLGTLQPGEEREIKVTGTLSGQEGDERTFRFTAGALKSEDSRDFGISYTVADGRVMIAKPFLSVGLALNREETPTLIVTPDQSIVASLSWENTLDTPITDAKISVALTGDALDPNSIVSTGGFYRSSDKTVVFDRETNGGLANLQPGDTGNGSFVFKSKQGSALGDLRNPTVTLTVNVSGRRTVPGQLPENITSTITRTVKVQSAFSLSSRMLRSGGGFTNTGPMPPKADTETTYTVELSATNSVNSVAGGKVVAVLPSYVRFVQGTGFTFNETTREVTWTLGDLIPGASRTGTFQIAFLPSVSQKGTSPVLVMEQKFTGIDRFVQKEVTATAPALTTRTSDQGTDTQNSIVQ